MSRVAEEEFLEIIKGCIKKDRSSQNALYRLFYPYAMSICIRYSDSENEAITVVNDSFMKAFKSIKKFDQEKSFKPWFRKIVVNTSINHFKKQNKFKVEVKMDDLNNISGSEDILSNFRYQELVELVQTLSTSYRAVFNLYVIDGYKHHEIAEKLGISVSTSKSNLTRARANLKEMITSKLNEIYV